MRAAGVLAVVGCLVAVPPVGAQVIRSDARIVYGHHHLHVTDVAAHTRFWVDGLGGTVGPKKLGPFDVIRINNAVVLLQAVAPRAGGTKGSSVGHIGVEVPDMRAALARLRAAGYPIVTSRELPPTMPVKDEILVTGGLTVAFAMGPDDTLVELVENTGSRATGNHHLHFATTAPDEMKAWYAKTFGAKAAKLGPRDVQELPGVILMYTPAKEAPGTTKDRVLDHIGFEVKNLEAFCKELEAAGVKLDTPHRKVLGLSIAFLTDPWGTVIELTEGLDQY
ncbi:MAG: VOC family protein [Vicinamibacterales bacterium]